MRHGCFLTVCLIEYVSHSFINSAFLSKNTFPSLLYPIIDEENIPAITILDDLKRFIEKSYDDVKDKRFKELKNRLFTDGYLYFYQHVPSLYS